MARRNHRDGFDRATSELFPWWLALAGVFGAVRALYRYNGVRFDDSTLGIYWQFIDPQLLREDLWQSLWYLHSQPPLFNLFLGGVLKLPEPWQNPVFQGVFTALGLFCGLAVFQLSVRLGARPWTAWIAASVWTSHPSFVLIENWLMYDLPTAAALLCAALCLEKAWRQGSRLFLHLFVISVLVLCGLRSFFHPLCLWLCIGGLVWTVWRANDAGIGQRASRARRPALRPRDVAWAALVPLILLSAWQMKNRWLFDQWGTSSWLGMNAMRIAGSALAEADARELRGRGVVSPLIGVPPFSAIEAYPPELRADSPWPEVAVLTARQKSTGAVSFHHWAYLEISRAHLKDAFGVAADRPSVYLHGVAKAAYNFSQPPSRVQHLRGAAQALPPWLQQTESVLYGEIPRAFSYDGAPKSAFLTTWLGYPLLWLAAVGWLVRPEEKYKSARVLLTFAVATAIYAAGVGNALEVWENQRFRFYLDGFTVALAAVAVDWAWARIRRR